MFNKDFSHSIQYPLNFIQTASKMDGYSAIAPTINAESDVEQAEQPGQDRKNGVNDELSSLHDDHENRESFRQGTWGNYLAIAGNYFKINLKSINIITNNKKNYKLQIIYLRFTKFIYLFH